ncbi:MAG: tRNA (adenosine(37)-N6)-threonylcarbamoyltransferase complex transferase subunit TsaD [Planktomarina sp.]
MTTLTVLGIESSCDDTSAAVVQFEDGAATVLSNVVIGQNDLHSAFGGVVPEIAARAHAEKLDVATKAALESADIHTDSIDLIAATAGPGLIGGVMAGVMFAKGLCAGWNVPLIGVNHLAGHALTPHMTDGLTIPYLMLLVSGGHCQFLLVRGPNDFERLGGTIDDAPGEAFDKTARLLGLPQPGGPSIERAAKDGDAKAIPLPRPLLKTDDVNMSFSGLKTAVLRARDGAMQDGQISQTSVNDIAASFQTAVVDILTAKSERAFETYLALSPQNPSFAVAGGVAANAAIRSALENLCDANGITFAAPPLNLCTDNAAMIAYAGGLLHQAGHSSDMALAARPRWPLDENQSPLIGSGKKGPKA